MYAPSRDNLVQTASPPAAGLYRRYYPGALGLVGLVVLPLAIRSPFYQELLILVFLYAALASAWNLVGGYAGQFSLGHAAFFGIGAYTSSLLFVRYQISPWAGMLAGVALATLLALGIGYLTIRLRGPFFTLATIAFSEVLLILAVFFRDVTRGSEGLSIPFTPATANMMFHGKLPYVYLMLFLMLTVLAISFWVERSPMGYRLIALREDEAAAEAVGVDTLRAKLTATALSAALTAVCGTFYAQYFLWLEPQYAFSLDLSTQVALMAIIGGMGTVWGPVLGSALIIPLSLFLRGALGNAHSGLYLIIYGALLIVVVLFLPEGMVAAIRHLYQRLPGRAAPARR